MVSDNITCRRSSNTDQMAGPHLAAVLRACRQIHEEAIEVLVEQTLFRISLGARGSESVGKSGRLCLRTKTSQVVKNEEIGAAPLRDFSFFDRIQNGHLSVGFGSQVNPAWDALPVIRAIVATINSNRRYTTARLRFGLMTAITCLRLPDTPWKRFAREVKYIDFGCAPDIEVDQDEESWSKSGRQIFERFTADLDGELRLVRFEKDLGPRGEGCRLAW